MVEIQREGENHLPHISSEHQDSKLVPAIVNGVRVLSQAISISTPTATTISSALIVKTTDTQPTTDKEGNKFKDSNLVPGIENGFRALPRGISGLNSVATTSPNALIVKTATTQPTTGKESDQSIHTKRNFLSQVVSSLLGKYNFCMVLIEKSISSNIEIAICSQSIIT